MSLNLKLVLCKGVKISSRKNGSRKYQITVSALFTVKLKILSTWKITQFILKAVTNITWLVCPLSVWCVFTWRRHDNGFFWHFNKNQHQNNKLNLKFGNPGKISSILCGLTSKLRTEKHDTFHFKWVETVKSTLGNTGFFTIWENQYIDVAKFKACFVQRCKDIFPQKWLEEVSNNSQCTIYLKVKDSFNMEDYPVYLESCHKHNLIKFKTRTHHQRITKHRFHDTSADITCPLCASNEVADEFHHLFVCDLFKFQCDKYIPVGLLRLPHTSMLKNLFMRRENLTNVVRFAKIVMSKFKFRKNEAVNSPRQRQITTRSGRVVKHPVRLSL